MIRAFLIATVCFAAPVGATCLAPKTLIAQLGEKFGEVPVAAGIAEDDTNAGFLFGFTLNASTGTWSLLRTDTDGCAWIHAYGGAGSVNTRAFLPITQGRVE